MMQRSQLFCLLFLLIATVLHGVEPGDTVNVDKAGALVDLPDGLRLHLELSDKQIAAVVVDPENLAVDSDFESILLLVDNPGKPNDEWRTVLRPVGNTPVYSSPRRLYPPYDFRLRIIIRFVEKDPLTFHHVRFSQ